jgi:hypothetical protein
MGGKPVGIVLLLLACGGCHACQNCCDYLPPVADGPYSAPGQRAGSAFGARLDPGPLSEPESFDEEPLAEETVSAGINLTTQALLEIDD